MLTEEIRLNTSFASRKGFYSFPILIFVSGILSVMFAEGLIEDTGYYKFLESCHIAALFYGIFTGFLAFFGNDFLERIFGHLGLIINLPSTQPISHRKMTLLYFIKEIIFYSIFTLLPALLGSLLGGFYSNFDIINLFLFGLSLLVTFITGLSFAYLISSFYRISIYNTLLGSIGTLFLYMLIIKNNEITFGLSWYLNSNFTLFLISIFVPLTFTAAATLLVNEICETKTITNIGYMNRLNEYRDFFKWAENFSSPTIVSKERIDLQRSKTGIKMFLSFAFPLGFLALMNWFIDRGLPVEVNFNTIFYGVMVGFFGTMLYSWLNTIDSPSFYSTLPVTVSEVIKARLILFLTITWWIPLIFMTLIAYMSSEINLLPIGIIVMLSVGIYIVNYTAWATGLKTNSALFDSIVFIKFFFVSVPPMISMTILSLALNHKPSVILITLSIICGLLMFLSLVFYNRIEKKWEKGTFD